MHVCPLCRPTAAIYPPCTASRCGYDGPIYMTYPTKAMCPILLEDFRRVMLHREAGDASLLFSEQDVKNCMKKVCNGPVRVQLALRWEWMSGRGAVGNGG